MTSTAAFSTAAFDANGSNFAGIFQGLDSQRLRVIPTRQSQNDAGPQDFALDKGLKVNVLRWSDSIALDKAQQMKKRKKAGDLSVENSGIVILGSNQGTLLLYSPASNTIVNVMKTGSSSPICAIDQTAPPARVYALQLDGTLTEFDLARNILVASSVVPVADPTSLIYQPEFILGSTAPHLCKKGGNEIEITYSGFATPIRQLLMLGTTHFAAIADEDRQVLIYRLDTPRPLHSLMCTSTNAVHISAADDLSAVAVTTEDGQVHIFDHPLEPKDRNSGAQSKSKRSKQIPQSSPTSTINTVVVKKKTPLRVFQTRFADNHLVLVWAEQGSVPIFKSTPWRTDEGVVISEDITLEEQPSAPLAREHLVGGVDPASVAKYDEQSATVVSGENMADLSDEDDDNQEDDEGETLADKLEALEVEMDKRGADGSRKQQKSGLGKSSVSEEDEDSSEEESGSLEGQTLGARSNAGVEGSNSKQSRLRKKELKLKLSQPGSFATLLNQALVLGDKQLLEICLEERDATMIKTSIIKIEPALAARLLEHLASTMARSQNRSSTLTQWIRWTIVIHGAYLVTLPNLLKTLASLHSTLSSRASTLPRLLALQGRLELLDEQLTIRGELAAASADDDADVPEAYYEEEEEALIVNGEEANDDLSEGEEAEDISGDDVSVMEEDEIMLSDE